MLFREFGRDHYEHFVKLNFVTDPSARVIFGGSLDANTIITKRLCLVAHGAGKESDPV